MKVLLLFGVILFALLQACPLTPPAAQTPTPEIATPPPARCGDGILQGSEQCDLGLGQDQCTAADRATRCNAVSCNCEQKPVTAPPSTPRPTATPQPTPTQPPAAACGDGVKDPSEFCDWVADPTGCTGAAHCTIQCECVVVVVTPSPTPFHICGNGICETFAESQFGCCEDCGCPTGYHCDMAQCKPGG